MEEFEEEEQEEEVEVKSDNKTPDPPARIEHQEVVEENAWANEEFGLEAVLQKTHSQVLKKEALDNIDLNVKQESPKPTTIDNTPNTPLSTEDLKEREKSRSKELVSSEIFNIAMGNLQQMETSKIVENITSKASSNSRSKFFNGGDSDNDSEEHDPGDVIDDILSTDFSKMLFMPEEKRNKNYLFTVKEESYTPESNTNKSKNFSISNHRSNYSFGDIKSNLLSFDLYNDNN